MLSINTMPVSNIDLNSIVITDFEERSELKCDMIFQIFMRYFLYLYSICKNHSFQVLRLVISFHPINH